LVETFRQQRIDNFLANLGGKATTNYRIRRLAGSKTGNARVLLVIGRNALEGRCDLISRNIQNQLASTLGVQNRAMLVAFMVVVVFGMVMASSRISRKRLDVAFDGFSRTQRFAFRAQPAPIEIPNIWPSDPQ
jgi:hypothetical protein